MRLKRCKQCGVDFETDKRDTVLCPHCSRAVKQASVVRPRTCIDCGVSFPGGPRARRCPTCRREADRKTSLESQRRAAKGLTRRIGSVDFCAVCGKEYIVQGSRQRYCTDCAPEAVAKVVREHKREYMAVYSSDPAHAEHKAAMHSNNKVCIICGKVFDDGQPSVTCSPECDKAQRKAHWAKADAKRSPRRK